MVHTSDRRHFLATSLGLAAYSLPLASFILNACKSVGGENGRLASDGLDAANNATAANAAALTIGLTYRRSATAASNQQNVELYRKAVGAMKATTFPTKNNGKDITWWEAHALIHNNYCPHGNWFFLPWHRAYLHYFERVIRAFCGDDSFALPYWDWTADASIPDAFTSGDEKSNALFDATRNVAPGQPLGITAVDKTHVEDILNLSDFFTFAGGNADRTRVIDNSIPNEIAGYSGRLESGPHNNVHSKIGGDMGNFLSPRDPIFWLHHCNVDRLWYEWTKRRAEKTQDTLPYDPPATGDNARLTRTYWLNYKVTGYYSVSKTADTYAQAPATFLVSDVVDPSKLGLVYGEPPTPKADEGTTPAAPTDTAATPTTPATSTTGSTTTPDTTTTPAATAPAATTPAATTPAATTPAATTPAATAPAPVIDASGSPTIPVPTVTGASSKIKSLKSRWKAAVDKLIHIDQTIKKSAGLVDTSASTTIVIAGSSDVDSILTASAKPRGTKEATLRLTVQQIPLPKMQSSQLEFYLNADNLSSVSDGSPEFIGSMGFFGHGHADAKVSAAFDMVPTVKRLVAARRLNISGKKPLSIYARWVDNSSPESLDGLKVSLTYLELG